MAIGRITGPMLQSDLERQGYDIAIDGNLTYFDVTNRRVGVNTALPQYTLDVYGNARVANLTILGNTINSNIGSVAITSNLLISAGGINSTSPYTGTLKVAGGAGIANDLWIGGNIYADGIVSNSAQLTISDPILYLSSNSTSPYNYEIGFYGHLTGGSLNVYQHSGVVRNHVDNTWTFFSNTPEPTGSTVNLSNAWVILDTIKAGAANLANTTPSTSTSTGALVVAGGAGIAGALYITNTGDVSANIGARFTSFNTLDANVAAYQIYANANAATQATSINSINANVGAYEIYANANIGAITNRVQVIDANIGAYETWANATIASIESNALAVSGNTIPLGANTTGALVSNATTLTTSTYVTNAIAQLNLVLGKLVPPAPPAFPGSGTLTLSTSTTTGRMCTFTQTDNSGWGNLSVAGGSSVSATRVSTYATSTISSVGPGDSGTVYGYLNGVSAGSVTLTGASNGTYSNLIIANNQDYHNVVSSVAAGFWYSFDARLSGSSVAAGWSRANIFHTGSAAGSNTISWYYDNSAPGTPTFSNTSVTLTSNTVTYSSMIPHLTTSAAFRIKGNIARLSGDTYPLAVASGSSTLVSGTAGGALSAPTAVTYTGAGVTVPLAQNLYVSSGSAYFETTTAPISGFGSSASGPSLSVNNNYATGSSGALTVSGSPTILYKTGTGTSIEETSISIGASVGSGSGSGYRIVNPGSSDTPTQAASATAFNSTTGPFYTYDATNVGSGAQGVIKFDQTNYSSGYIPVGPNLSTQGANQYFTFKFIRSSVSKFDISFTGTIAGLWVALPGSTIDSTSSLNGWLSMATAYGGSGIPGANTGAGGNGSDGCALGGVVSLNSAGTQSRTATFGTVSSSSTATNEIYIRIKLTSGQSLTALSIVTATH